MSAHPRLAIPLLSLPSLLAACGPSPTLKPPPSEIHAEQPTTAEEAPSVPPVRNLPPRITQLELKPDEPVGKDNLILEIRYDDEDRDVLDLQRTWFLNDRELHAEKGHTLPSGYVKKGDRVRVAVSVSDGKATVTGETPEKTIRNTPPRIVNRLTDLSQIDGFRIQAEDPDGDTLTFKLEGAPPALTLDGRSGVLSYKGSPDDEGGNYDVTLVVDDGDGGFAKWTFKMGVEPGSAARQKAERAKAEAERPRYDASGRLIKSRK